MSYTGVSDGFRVYVATLAVLLVVMSLRLAWQRLHSEGIGRGVNPHPIGLMGMALVLGAVAAAHYESFGNPASWRFWLVVVGYTLTAIGFALSLAWRRPRLPLPKRDATHADDQG